MYYYRVVLWLLIMMMLSATAVAQQNPNQNQSMLPAIIEVQGMAEVLGTLQRIEYRLQQLQNSRWEYMFVQRNRLEDVEEQIKQLGTQGWELVNVTLEEGYILKRPVYPQ